jgi:hypothetical protein
LASGLPLFCCTLVDCSVCLLCPIAAF